MKSRHFVSNYMPREIELDRDTNRSAGRTKLELVKSSSARRRLGKRHPNRQVEPSLWDFAPVQPVRFRGRVAPGHCKPPLLKRAGRGCVHLMTKLGLSCQQNCQPTAPKKLARV